MLDLQNRRRRSSLCSNPTAKIDCFHFHLDILDLHESDTNTRIVGRRASSCAIAQNSCSHKLRRECTRKLLDDPALQNENADQDMQESPQQAMEKHSNDLVHTEATTRSLFEFRDRLWHEPPELDYSGFESYDDIQHELKAMDGEHFQWKTNRLDLTAERHLLLDYMCWASDPERDESLPQAEREFYYHLYDSLVVDREENMAGLKSNKQRFGMKGED